MCVYAKVHGDIDFTEQDAIEAAMAMEENFNSSLSDFRGAWVVLCRSILREGSGVRAADVTADGLIVGWLVR